MPTLTPLWTKRPATYADATADFLAGVTAATAT